MSESYQPPVMPEPPAIEGPNVFPLEWPVETPKIWELYERAKRETWNPTALDWSTLHAGVISPEQRLGVLYFYAIDGLFENSGVAAFAQAAIRCYEDHTEDPTKRVFITIARDELTHDEFCKRVCDTLSPGFPQDFVPQTPLEEALQRNVQWASFNAARYWDAYVRGFRKYPLEVLFCSFMTAELLGVVLYDTMGKKATLPLFQEAFRLFHRDETRHFALTQYLLESGAPKLTDEGKQTVRKQIRAGFDLMSLLFWEPIPNFWRLPDGFIEVHRRLLDAAAESGIGALTFDERTELCRDTMLRLQRLMARFDIPFPAIPEIGITGIDTTIDPDDFVLVAL
jgi:hypothetical protein